MGTADTSFRDQLYNTDTSGRRVGFFPKRPKGKLYTWRGIFSLFLLAIFFGTPWISVGDESFMLFNILERKFIILGQVFWPQDTLVFVIGFITLIVFIILFTVAFGRLWCGWACPQTIFLEMVYRRIEYWIEGDAPAQRRLAKEGMSWKKFRKRALKHSIFVGIAFLVSNTVLSYVVGKDELFLMMKAGPAEYPMIFVAVVANTAAFYFIFAWFREQACIFVCPYGRLQSVLLDSNTMVISYDYKRGEPRGRISRKAELNEGKGDCIDCRQCIAVCPTGIDIRNGTQLECVNCTACIDACDDIMEKVKRPKGLIRFASSNQIESGKKWKLNTRVLAYSGLLTVLAGILVTLLLTRSDFSATVLRASGATYSETAEGNYSNIFTLKIINKSRRDREFTVGLDEEYAGGTLKLIGSDVVKVEGGDGSSAVFMVDLPPDLVNEYSFKIPVHIYEKGEKVETLKARFTGPMM